MARARNTKKSKMNDEGKAGCGCLVFTLIVMMVVAGLGFHPLSLKFFAKCLRYEDPIITADAVFVPRFTEDKDGELYSDAFREYFAGNGRTIYVENEKAPGNDVSNVLRQMARARGIKESVVKTVYLGEMDGDRSSSVKGKLRAAGLKKVILIVPEYASRRYHMMYSLDPGGTIYMIKPLKVSYFQSDRWWRDDLSRTLIAREMYNASTYCYKLLKKETGK